MKMSVSVILLLLLCFGGAFCQDMYPYQAFPATEQSSQITAGIITIEVTGFRNNNGQALIGLFNSETGFPTDPNAAYKVAAVQITNGYAICTFSGIPGGEYAVFAIHDEDADGDFDRDWLFLPAEGWGTSNDSRGIFGPGGYKDARFILNSDTAVIYVMIHYSGIK